MIKIIDKEKCSGCHACMSVCPKNSINMKPDDEGFLYPNINLESCIDCGACDIICPYNNTIKGQIKEQKAYAAVNKDKSIQEKSSSGGVFTLLAERIINCGGVVFGAFFDDNFNVKHGYVANVKDLEKLRGSKYVQSEIGNSFKEAKKYLEEGNLVLFTGTPCQISGLKAYLRKDYENLFTQDIICHGVPSPMVWQKYVRHRSALAGASARSIFSRHKKYGWKRYSVSFSFENDTEYLCQVNSDPFMQTFLKNLCLRYSCYSCKSNGEKRVSDITLADFWGIENVDKEMDYYNGTSLVIVNTNKGAKLLRDIEKALILKEENLDDAVKYNPCFSKSVLKPKQRDDFMKLIANKDFQIAYNMYVKETAWDKIINLLKRVKRKLFRR